VATGLASETCRPPEFRRGVSVEHDSITSPLNRLRERTSSFTEVGKTDTAWSYRDSTLAQVIVGVDPDPANKDKIVNWARDYWTELCPYSAAGAYVNFMMDEGEERVRATYGENYERLSSIKAKYDPDNFFRMNQNIRPGNQHRNADIA
jgi:hypothetical protein